MERIITFNEKSALLCASEHQALLTVNAYILPVELADVIGEAGDVHVSAVFLDDNCRTGVIRILHDLTPSELLEIVCEAISRVFDADTSVSYARPENAV